MFIAFKGGLFIGFGVFIVNSSDSVNTMLPFNHSFVSMYSVTTRQLIVLFLLTALGPAMRL